MEFLKRRNNCHIYCNVQLKWSLVDIYCPSVYELYLVTGCMYCVDTSSKGIALRLAGYLALTLGLLLMLV